LLARGPEESEMPRTRTTLLALTGLTTAACAQSVSLNFSASVSDYSLGDTITWTVSASFSGFDDPSAYFGGFVGTFLANDPGFGTAHNFVNLLAGEGTPPTANGAIVDQINIFNAAILGTNDPSNPIDFFRFDVTMEAFGRFSYDATGLAFVFPDDGIFTLAHEFDSFEVTSDELGIPAPGVGAVLAVAGPLLAARRRR
jgi:hypothetical protein